MPDDVRSYLIGSYGSVLMNTVRRPGLTCSVCATPVLGFPSCFRCGQDGRIPGLADAVGSVVYAVAGGQSHHLMRSYKWPRPVPQSRTAVFLLLWSTLALHLSCVSRITAREVTHWATVPSLPARPGEHPLHALAGRLLPHGEVSLSAAPVVSAGGPRSVHPTHYRASALDDEPHVLVIDDTWTTGGHAQSAALALRSAGASTVSVLSVARHVDPAWAPTRQFLDGHNPRFDPTTCP